MRKRKKSQLEAHYYLRDAENLSAYHSPQNYKKTCHHPSKSGLHHPVSGAGGCVVGRGGEERRGVMWG